MEVYEKGLSYEWVVSGQISMPVWNPLMKPLIKKMYKFFARLAF